MHIIGDVHGKSTEYLTLIQDLPCSVQVGDLGFDYSFLSSVDSNKHRFLAGNHDDYSILKDIPHSLGDYGMNIMPDGTEFFHIRGAYSIDKDRRIQGTTWFPEEELTIPEGYSCMDLYEATKPHMVISHTCPISLLNKGIVGSLGVENRTRTNVLLQGLLEIHAPKIWVFGHFHTSVDEVVNGTRFVCLSELETMTY